MESFVYFPLLLWEGGRLEGGEGYEYLDHTRLRNLRTDHLLTSLLLTQPPSFFPVAEAQELPLTSGRSVGNGARTALDCMLDF